MTSQSDSWTEKDQAAFTRVQDLFLDDNFHNCLVAASELLERAKSAGQSSLYQVLGEIIRQCANEIAPVLEAHAADPACSFCGKSQPEVRMGAGPAAFICNECADAFAKIFEASPPPS